MASVKTPEFQLAQRIRIAREELELTQQAVATEMNRRGFPRFTQQKVWVAERTGKIEIRAYLTLAQILGIETPELVDGCPIKTLRRWRIIANISQQKLAEKLRERGVIMLCQQKICNRERGVTRIFAVEFLAIAEVFEEVRNNG